MSDTTAHPPMHTWAKRSLPTNPIRIGDRKIYIFQSSLGLFIMRQYTWHRSANLKSTLVTMMKDDN